ncbi:hypothetical protein BJ138DRAFT_1099475, partial [Hygrophoropsis aurantiaca]
MTDNCPFPLPPSAQKCHCGRSFAQENAFTNHVRTCSKTKRRISQALTKAKELWSSRKRRKLGVVHNGDPTSIDPHEDGGAGGGNEAHTEPGSNTFLHAHEAHTVEGGNLTGSGDVDPRALTLDDATLSLAERRPRRLDRQMPKRFRDNVPQSLHALPLPIPAGTPLQQNLAEALPSSAAPSISPSADSPLFRRILKSTKNVFGLFRQYRATEFPAHDPEERTTLRDLTNFESNPQTYSN